MPLVCGWGYGEDWEWHYGESRFRPAPVGRRKRCKSCQEPINVRSDALEVDRARHPRSEIEAGIYGDESEPCVPLASWWLCEACGGLYLSLLEIGYAVQANEDMRELVQEHAAAVRAGDGGC